MINTVYRLVAPRRFEIAFEDIDLFGDNAIVRPTNLSICNADMRYYLGTRDAKVLAEKLPMALSSFFKILWLIYGRLFAGVCGDFASAAGETASGHQYECGGVYGDRVRSGARHFSV